MSTYDSGASGLEPSKNYGLRNCVRHICSHNEQGKSIFASSPELLYSEATGAGAVARSYAVETIPAVLNDDADVKAYLSKETENNVTSHKNRALTIPGGANLVVVNFAPGGISQMHRTVSIDFSICVEGEIEMELDNGDSRKLGPGVSQLLVYLI